MEVYTFVHRLCAVKMQLLPLYIPSSQHSLCVLAYIVLGINSSKRSLDLLRSSALGEIIPKVH